MDPHLLDHDSTAARLRAAGLRLAPSALAQTAEEAADAAGRLGCSPLVVKAAGLLHKSDSGGVILDLGEPAAVQDAARTLLGRLGDAALPLLVQQQLGGAEVLVGVRRHGDLGAVVVAGLGGVHTELFADVARALTPVDRREASSMLRRLRAWPLLAGYRGGPPADVDALCDVLVRVSELAEHHEDIVELDLNPVLVGPPGEGAVVVDARMLVGPPPDRRDRPPRDLERLLRPERIAGVGVSDDEDKIGARLFRYLTAHSFPGRIDPVHPAGGEVRGRTRYASLKDLPEPPDLVCVAVPARAVPQVAHEAVAAGAGAVLVHSSGFAEIGEEGARLQAEVSDVLAEAGVPLAGPNNMGIVDPARRMAASISGGLEAAGLVAGPTALVTGSGALGSCIATRLMGKGVGLSHWIHVGNEADLVTADYLDWLAEDDGTATVGLLLEDLKDGARFVEAGRRLARAGKPVFAYNMVRSERGREAARSHTGALVGSYEVREEVLRAAGVVSVPTLQVLEDALQLASAHPLPRGNRLVALTFSGGACTIIADEAERLGLELPALSEETRARVQELVPAYAAVRNPLDVSYQLVTDPEGFRGAVSALVGGDEFDAVLVQFTTNADPNATATAEAVLGVSESVDVPVFVSRFGGPHLAPRALQRYADAGVPVLDAPDRTMQAIGALCRASAVMRSASGEEAWTSG